MKAKTKIKLIIVLSILLAIGLGYIGFNLYIDSMLSNMNEGEIIDEEQADIAEEVVKYVEDRNVLNIALFGCDRSSQDSLYAKERSDAIKIISLDYDNKEVKISNLERDVVVYAPGDYQGYLHFNWAYWYGGAKLAVQTINYNFDLDITKYVTISFGALEDIINAVGGVDINLTSAEASVLGLYSGVNHLNGKQAMDYARIRKIDSDFVRVERQNNLIKAVVSKMMNESLDTIMNVVNAVLPSITTNLTSHEIKDLAMDLLSFDLTNIETNTEPHGEYNDIMHCPGIGGYLVRSYSDMSIHLHDFIYGEEFVYQPSKTLLENEKRIYETYGEFTKE